MFVSHLCFELCVSVEAQAGAVLHEPEPARLGVDEVRRHGAVLVNTQDARRPNLELVVGEELRGKLFQTGGIREKERERGMHTLMREIESIDGVERKCKRDGQWTGC